MSESVIAAKAPIAVEAGKTYWWCACGKSAMQPFCDGSYQPLCDGSHKKL